MKRGEQEDSWDDEPEGRYLTTAMPRPLVVRGGRGLTTTGGAGARGDEPTPEINLLAYWHVLMKHRLVIAACIAGMLVMGLVVTLLTTPVYRATAMIQLDRQTQNVVGQDIQDVTPNEVRDP